MAAPDDERHHSRQAQFRLRIHDARPAADDLDGPDRRLLDRGRLVDLCLTSGRGTMKLPAALVGSKRLPEDFHGRPAQGPVAPRKPPSGLGQADILAPVKNGALRSSQHEQHAGHSRASQSRV
jgi:hypothetical protein